jgi:hypothetical protein
MGGGCDRFELHVEAIHALIVTDLGLDAELAA